MVSITLLAAWFAWASLARVSVLASSTQAQIELADAIYRIDSPFLARITGSNLIMGQRVRRGDLLVQLDSSSEERLAREALVRVDGYGAQLRRLRAQLDAERDAGKQERVSAHAALQEAESRAREADIAAATASLEAARIRTLHERKMVADRALDIADAEARRLEAASATAQAAIVRSREDQSTRDHEREVRVQRLEGELAALQAEEQTVRAEVDQLNNEIERRRIRAPVSGTIAEARTLRPGEVVDEGDSLASIAPENGQLRVVAQFPATLALGRIRVGQRAVLRLDGFPWAQYGSVPAIVSGVAQETRDGSVRVELALQPEPAMRFPLEHGMPGKVEVLIERLSPLALLSRTAGQWLTERP